LIQKKYEITHLVNLNL